MKVQAGGLKLYQKRDSDTGAVEFSRTMFLLENFLEFWMYLFDFKSFFLLRNRALTMFKIFATNKAE